MSATTGVGAVGMTLGIITGMIHGIVTALGGLIPAGIMARVGASAGVGSMQAGMILGGGQVLIGAAATGAAVIIGDITIMQGGLTVVVVVALLMLPEIVVMEDVAVTGEVVVGTMDQPLL